MSILIHSLPLNSDVLVWHEGKTGYAGKWTGPYKLLSTEGETYIIGLLSRPTLFCTTVVKLYQTPTIEDDPDTDILNNLRKSIWEDTPKVDLRLLRL